MILLFFVLIIIALAMIAAPAFKDHEACKPKRKNKSSDIPDNAPSCIKGDLSGMRGDVYDVWGNRIDVSELTTPTKKGEQK